jgi:hypothetical protein
VTPFLAACSLLRWECQAGLKVVMEALAETTATLPASAGYEPWLIDHGAPPIFARPMAAIIVRRKNRIQKEGKRIPEVVAALHFLAHPRRNKPATAQRVKTLLGAWDETSIVETFFSRAGLHEGEFIRLLKSFAAGEQAALGPLREIAASLVPHLRIPRGPKVGAVSSAHEFFLKHAVKTFGSGTYTWDDGKGKYTDPITETTRRGFGLKNYDPRPAHRRLKGKQRSTS